MAKNKLAPPARNALADETQRLLRQTTEAGPQYGELVDYLSARRMMPPVELQNTVGIGSTNFDPDASGMFETGGRLPETGKVFLRNDPKRPRQTAKPQTVVHELTHAAERQIRQQWSSIASLPEWKLTPEQLQFKKAYERLIFKPGEQFGKNSQSTQQETAMKIAPEWIRKNADYRATGGELTAFGMGSALGRNVDNPAPLHIDPSYATEFSILLDLARRANVTEPGR